MLNKTLYKETKKIFLYTLSVFILLSLAYLSIALVIQLKTDKIQKNEICKSEERLADVEQTIVSNKVNRLITDVLYLSDSLKICNTNRNGDYSNIEKQWLAFSNRKKIYDQIRFIDVDGNEVIRVNYSEDGSYITEKDELQNKKDRYYFTDTISLNENQIYISKLDLNIENDMLEQPIKPMIRLSTPYYGEDGKIAGIVILNYSANDMLQQVKKIASTSHGNIFMLNANGYWVYNGEDSDKDWTFMYDDRKNENFQNEFPEEWKKIKSNGKSSLITSNGVFNYTNILTSDEFSVDNANYSLVLGEGDWYIVSYISPDTQNGKLFSGNICETLFNVFIKNIIVYVLIFFIALIFAVLMTINKIKNDKIKYFSEYDTMTGVFNRRAGFEKLNQLYKDATKNSNKMSVCFIDINGLKEVNDFLGHEAGDELILSIISGVKKNIRENDFIARLGGDEFLIILQNMNEEESETVWKRINEEFAKINETENRKYIISASHGIEEFKFNSNESIDSIINHADEKMYNEKRIIKKDLKVVRQARTVL